MVKITRKIVSITDKETIAWLQGESKRRGDGTLARTAMKVIAEFRAMREREQCAAADR